MQTKKEKQNKPLARRCSSSSSRKNKKLNIALQM